jgi:drug/metabolite transporter (DMT)-like permease
MTNTTPFWVLLISFVFFRGSELFTPRVLGGTALTVAGVILLSTFGTVG